MNALKYAFGLILVGGFALTASCGGSSDTTSGSSGGSSSSTGGTSSSTGGGLGTGNNTGNGGTFSSNGGTGTTTGGTGTTTGGTGTTTGGTGGTGTATGGTGGGTIMNPAGCPATAPAVTMMGTPGEACTPLPMGQSCSYTTSTGTERCFCAPSFGGPGGGAAGAGTAGGDTWACTVRQTPMACPAGAATGDMCTATCTLPNNGGTCRCFGGMLRCPRTGMGAAGAGG